jgi:hypothetical protein
MRHPAFAGEVTRDDLLAWYRANRARSRELFDLVVPEAYFDRPISLRNPIMFYEGHLPAFSVNTLVKLTMKRKGIDERLETLFARGIDPEDEASVKSPTDLWPSREEVQAYAHAADELIEETLTEPNEAAFTILEHEAMHQETLLYMLHQLAHEKKRPSRRVFESTRSSTTGRLDDSIPISPGKTKLGTDAGTFGWDNEFSAHIVDVAEFTIDPRRHQRRATLEYINAVGEDAALLNARRARVVLARHVRDDPAAARRAGVRHARRSIRVRALAQRAVADRGRMASRVRLRSHRPERSRLEWTSTLFAPYPGFAPMRSYRSIPPILTTRTTVMKARRPRRRASCSAELS